VFTDPEAVQQFIEHFRRRSSAQIKNDELVKSQKSSVFVIPANAGIQGNKPFVDPRFRGDDGLGNFLRDHQEYIMIVKFDII